MKVTLKIDPAQTGGIEKSEALELTESLLERMFELLYMMYAENRRSLLIILHGIDASGKDGTIRTIFAGMNPQGTKVYSFKKPSEEELSHDFLWRCHRLVPERGTTAIFNRSYYEDVTTVMVHPELLADRNLPKSAANRIFLQRYRQINEFERMLVENDTVVLKFFLHISKAEQKQRFLARLEDPSKNWKFSLDDLKARTQWDKYQKAFTEMIKRTNTRHCPWHVIPADKKWYRNYLVAREIVRSLEKQKMKYPRMKGKTTKID